MADDDDADGAEIDRLTRELGRAADARDEKRIDELTREAKKKGIY